MCILMNGVPKSYPADFGANFSRRLQCGWEPAASASVGQRSCGRGQRTLNLRRPLCALCSASSTNKNWPDATRRRVYVNSNENMKRKTPYLHGWVILRQRDEFEWEEDVEFLFLQVYWVWRGIPDKINNKSRSRESSEINWRLPSRREHAFVPFA